MRNLKRDLQQGAREAIAPTFLKKLILLLCYSLQNFYFHPALFRVHQSHWKFPCIHVCKGADPGFKERGLYPSKFTQGHQEQSPVGGFPRKFGFKGTSDAISWHLQNLYTLILKKALENCCSARKRSWREWNSSMLHIERFITIRDVGAYFRRL